MMSTLTAALLLAGCTSGQAPDGDAPGTQAKASRLALVYSNNVDGEIEPCG